VVLANSSIQLLMKQDSTTIDAVSDAFRLSTGERHYLLGCHKGEGLLFARGGHVQLRVEASPVEHALITTDPRELAQIARPPTSKETDDRQERVGEPPSSVHTAQTIIAADGVKDEIAPAPNEVEDEDEVDDDEEEHGLVNEAAVFGEEDGLPRLRVVARSGRTVSRADALGDANHHSVHHQRDDAEEGVGDDDAE
jgi:hypothetical protein